MITQTNYQLNKYAVENKNDIVICLWMEKTSKAKISLGDFNVTTSKNPLLSQQAVTSKEILVRNTRGNTNKLPTK